MSDKTLSNESSNGLNEGTLLNRMTNRIRQSLELQEILSATVREVRSFLGTDRVKIYQFQADGSGQVIAESIHDNRLPSLLGLFFHQAIFHLLAGSYLSKHDNAASLIFRPNRSL